MQFTFSPAVENSKPLTDQEIESLSKSASINDARLDHFNGDPDFITHALDAAGQNNSRFDSAYLFLAANTAILHNRIEDAAFFLYAGQIRMRFDMWRFGLGEADGNNIQTYLGYVNQQSGEVINPLIMRQPALYAKAIDRLEKWTVIPDDNAPLYKENHYGDYKEDKSKWNANADEIKTFFLKNMGWKIKTLLADHAYFEAVSFIQDYNFNKIKHSDANKAKYDKFLQIYTELGHQYDIKHGL